MEENSAEMTSNLGTVIVKWVAIILLTLGILGGIFWGLFYSLSLANLPFMIPLRSEYQKVVWSIEGIVVKPNPVPPFYNPVYTIKVVPSVPPAKNTYTLWGKFERVDSTGSIIFIRGYDGKIYAIKMSKYLADLSGFGISDYAPAKNLVNLATPVFSAQSSINVIWEDTRTLSEIYKKYNVDSLEPLNINSSTLFTFTKFN